MAEVTAEKKAHWHGPGHVLGVQGSRIWVAHAAKVYRCSPEQVKRINPEHERLVRMLPDDVQACKKQLRERGARNMVDLEGREAPPPECQDTSPEETVEDTDDGQGNM